MTCIIGWVDRDKTHIMSDGQITSGYNITCETYKKIYVNGDVVAGFAGWHTVLPIAEKVFTQMDTTKISKLKDDIWDIFLKPVIEEINRRGLEGDSRSFSIIAAKGNELIVSGDNKSITSSNLASIGSGSNAAQGAFLALDEYRKDMTAKEKLEIAMRVASRINAGCNDNMQYCNTDELRVINIAGKV